jgi:hypothetical protein
MALDISLLIVSLLIQAALAGLGFWVAFDPAVVQRYRNIKIIFFFLVGSAAICAIVLGIRASVSQSNLEQLTGGDSYAFLIPQTHGGRMEVPFVIRNTGKSILTGVAVEAHSADDFAGHDDRFRGPQINVGTLFPEEFRLINYSVLPKPKKGIATYIFWISAQNGRVDEVINFRPRTTPPRGWEFQIKVTKTVYHADGTTKQQILRHGDWRPD